jgi:hypothetical protein
MHKAICSHPEYELPSLVSKEEMIRVRDFFFKILKPKS